MSELDKQDVLITRTQTNKGYEVSKLHLYVYLPYIILIVFIQHYRRVPVVKSECSRSVTECCLGRTFRDTSQNQVCQKTIPCALSLSLSLCLCVCLSLCVHASVCTYVCPESIHM